MNAMEKICVACGQSCAGQPRIKDPAGNYYHKECHERLQAAREKRQAQAAPPPVKSPEPVAPLHPPAPEVPPQAQPAAIADHDLPDQAAPAACPGCGEPMLLGAVICTNCGFNAQTGRMVDGADLPRGDGGGKSGPAWPLFIGVVSIAFGGSGILLQALIMVGGLLEGAQVGEAGAFIAGGAIGSLLSIALSVWLLTAGIGIIQHKQTAAVSIRRWAVVKVVLYATCFTCLSAGILFLGGMAERINEEVGEDGAAFGTGLLLLVFAAIFAWLLFWPVFILIWFGREGIQEQLGRWR
jgi:hypothetical protein